MYKPHTIQTIIQLFFRNLTRTHKKVAHTSVTDCVRQITIIELKYNIKWLKLRKKFSV